jgi:hypothetical protein
MTRAETALNDVPPYCNQRLTDSFSRRLEQRISAMGVSPDVQLGLNVPLGQNAAHRRSGFYVRKSERNTDAAPDSPLERALQHLSA